MYNIKIELEIPEIICGTTIYSYVYNGSSLSQMTVGTNVLTFSYDANGLPMAVTYNGTDYYYVSNIQGDIIAILDSMGNVVVTYSYDAWGNHLSTGGTLSATLGTHNPLRYRGYAYDTETQLYYLQSRYYNSIIGRFLNTDAFASTGFGIIGNNMFAYCNNNPVIRVDSTGELFGLALGIVLASTVIGGLLGAFSAAATGGNVVEGIVEGCLTGAVSAVIGLSPLGPVSGALLGAACGALIDFSVQTVVAYQETGDWGAATNSVDLERTYKMAAQTGLAVAIPAFGSGYGNYADAIGTVLIWGEGSALITCADVVYTNLSNQTTGDNTVDHISPSTRITNLRVCTYR